MLEGNIVLIEGTCPCINNQLKVLCDNWGNGAVRITPTDAREGEYKCPALLVNGEEIARGYQEIVQALDQHHRERIAVKAVQTRSDRGAQNKVAVPALSG